ncbi:MAG: hypothetical protein ACOZQL_01525 [Myxococcota bacterium]
MRDVTRLKHEVQTLKHHGDGLAHFAAALFELELAREGDAESRSSLSRLAELLLVFWRDGSGDALSRVHPALESLWLSVAPMLVQFELRQFDQALLRCWKLRDDPRALAGAIAALSPEGNRRVEFARCLYHLELARRGVQSSRAEFARRAGLLAEAYQDPAFASDLVGHDAGLLHLWGELKPYLDEFFEGLEEAAARAQESTRKVPMPQPPADEAPPKRAEVKTDPERPAAPPLGATVEVPSFRTLVKQNAPSVASEVETTAPAVPALAEDDLIIDEAPLGLPPVAPPIPPVVAPPPPPINLTPPGAWFPPSTPSGEVEIVDIVEDLPPPPPPVTPSHGLAAVLDDDDVLVELEPDPAVGAFWDYTFAALQVAPPEGQERPRMLASESRTDRKRLTTWLDGLGQHIAVPEAKAMGAMVRLMLAGETKEKSLFGQSNPRRKEALQSAFALLSPDPEAAGRVAVWFELDGPLTVAALDRGLELLVPFLAWCARNSADPLSPQAVTRYLEQ